MNYWIITEQESSYCLTNHYNLICFWISKEAFEELSNILNDKEVKTDRWEVQIFKLREEPFYDLTSFENSFSITLEKDVYLNLKEELKKWNKSGKPREP